MQNRLIPIETVADPRVAAFCNIRERDLTGREGLFIAEGEVVLRVLLSTASRCRPRALLLAENRVEAQEALIRAAPADVPVYVAPQAVLDGIAGFHLHRGILALGEKPPTLGLDAVLGDHAGRDATYVVASGIGNHDNMGGILRNAAAFGATAVVLDSHCCDPFYRKAIRVSVGAALRVPIVDGGQADNIVARFQAAGVEVLALTPSAQERLMDYRRSGPVALLLGSEGPGLPQATISRCRPIGIPMSGGFDSLNVAATSAVALHHLVMAS